MGEITRRFVPLARQIAWNLGRRATVTDDLFNAALFAVVTAVRRHRPGHPGFARFVATYMRGAGLREMTRWSTPEILVGHEPVEVVDHREPVGVRPWGDGEVAHAIARVQERHQHLLALRYVADLRLKDIASTANCTTAAVSQRLRTAHAAVASEIRAGRLPVA
jgi:RNA polymerase sigma factor (sigma-70 family)